MSDYIVAVLLGCIEGLTEFLPVSSTGHLIIFGNLFGFTGTVADTFEVFIQLGAILAVLVLYKERFFSLLQFEDESSGLRGAQGILKLAVGCLPAFILGFLLHKVIKEQLFTPSVVAISLIVGGIILILIKEQKNAKQSVDELTLKDCFLIGCFQTLSLCPGVSRSGATIVGGMLTGLSRSVAAEFSFLLAVPTMAAAVGYDLLKNYKYLSMHDLPVFLIGFLVSFIVAVVVIKSFVGYLKTASFKVFGWYRIALGMIVLFL